ncbi:Protein DGCR14-like [Papilio machaon]|uniref:Protein DGCR14-like n=1 Tax=Papilio machaon TaxID=76193 RepID=A0A0N1IHV9_PAPMA|nr:Protein DGCR14-like [Papilio machaon]
MASENNITKPGAAALENMALLQKESSVFKVPKVPKKKAVKKTEVLDEEEYVEGIAKIIQRDFFPDLEKLKAQNDYLEATENKDYARLQELTRKYSGNRPPTEPYNSPATFDTPGADRPLSPSTPIQPKEPETEQSTEKCRDITENHTLVYGSAFGSVKDASIGRIREAVHRVHQECSIAGAFRLYDCDLFDSTDTDRVTRHLQAVNGASNSFLAKHTSEDNASYDRVIALEDKKRATKLASQFEAEVKSAALADAALALPSIEEQADQTERPHELDTWKYKAKNYIMYVPAGAESQRPPPKPELRHINTRLRAPPFDHVKNKEAITAIAKTQDASISGKIGVDGVSLCTEKSGEAYSYVATPSPRPGAGPDQSPLMTWGEIEGTPFRLDGGDTPLPAVGAGAAYRMLEGGARERLALQLAERAARRRRPTTPRTAPHTPSFRTNTERLASMSPAARKLAAKHLLSPRLKLTPNDMGIAHSTTPKTTPHRTPLVATPNGNKLATPATDSVARNDTLTDNLLQINVAKRTRLKAQDFFNTS